MPTLTIPPQKDWTGIYLSSFIGTLWKTFNIDLHTNQGFISLSRKSTKVVDDSTLANLNNIVNFTLTNASAVGSEWWALVIGGKLFNSGGTVFTSGWALAAATGGTTPPTDAQDMIIHENTVVGGLYIDRLVVSRATDIDILNKTGSANAWVNSWWVGTLGQSALNSGSHPLDVFDRTLIIGDKNLVHIVDRNDVVTASRLVLPIQYKIEHIFHTASRIWICCTNLQGGSGVIVEWDNKSPFWNNIHDGYSETVLSGVDYRGIPIVINDRGMFLENIGSGFSPMIRGGQIVAFPIYTEDGVVFSTITSAGFASIVPRGMTVSQGLIYLNVMQAYSSGGISFSSYKQNGGIWCLDPVRGLLYNRYSIGQVGSAGDYGQEILSRAGAIKALQGSAAYQRLFIMGGKFYDIYVGTTRGGIFTLNLTTDIDSASFNRGYFVTNLIPTAEVQNFWETLWIKHRLFTETTNRIIVKAKAVDSLRDATNGPLDKTITWTSTTTFTVTLAAGDNALAVGDEVEVLTGDNSGALAHITVISGAHAALQTITIDEVLYASVAAAFARFDRWTKLGVISSTTSYEDVLSVGIKSSTIQLKVELRGQVRELILEEIKLNYETNLPSKK